MSIKSDNWIRRMAEQNNMITPFESGQVRYLEKIGLFLMELLVMGTMFAVPMNLKFSPIFTPKP